MSEFSPEERAMFRRARQDLEPTSSDRDRNAHALATRLGIGAGALAGSLAVRTASASASAAAGAASSATSGVSTSLAVLAGKWLAVGLLLGGSLVAGVVAVHGHSRAVTPAAASASVRHPSAAFGAQNTKGANGASRAVASPPAAPIASQLATPAPALARPVTSPPNAMTSGTPAPALGNVSEEAHLLRRAHGALQSGGSVYALQLLDELARRFPNGVLTEERSAERISALCKLGRIEPAREEAARFLSSTPGSPLAKRVKASCGAPLDESLR